MPDELLGSWLARLRELNGEAAWDAFSFVCGFEHKDHSSRIFDIEHQIPPYMTLLERLGWEVGRAEACLTTNPFWQVFGGYRRHTKKDIRFRQKASAKLRLGSSPARYCPLCIADDVAEAGIPYWRRTHQVPVVLVCPIHGGPLRTRCPNCMSYFSRTGKMQVVPLTIACPACGVDLRHLGYVPDGPIYSNYVKLAKFASLAINSNTELGDLPTIFSNFAAGFRQWRQTRKTSLGELFSDAYGLQHQTSYTLADKRATGRLNLCQPISLSISLGYAGASEAAAFLALTDLPYDVCVQCLNRPLNLTKSIPKPRSVSKIVDLDDARKRFLAAHATFYDPLELKQWMARNGKFVAQFLRVRDSEWLSAYVTFATPLQSVEKDRADLLSMFRACKGQTHLPAQAHGLQAFRAELRDSEWFEELYNVEMTKRQKHRLLLAAHRVAGQANAISNALWTMAGNRKERPRFITENELIARTGLSVTRLRSTIRAHPGLKMDLDTAHAELVGRRLRWAASIVDASGETNSPTKMFKMTPLRRRYTEVMTLARSLLAVRDGRSGV